MGSNPSEFKNPASPVEEVTWDETHVFLAKIGGGFRLPTEAEWEYACRAGSTTAYCFGDDVARLGDYAWFKDNTGYTTYPVGQKKPNAWGIHDMHGNVCEWCEDWYGDYPSEPVTDPTGPESGAFRVRRGGCWNYEADASRSAFRGRSLPGYQDGRLGFRLACSSPSGA
jgi:formylglycine-generating enzyme required for sulfatase activity